MKKGKEPKRLGLKKETLRALTARELTKAQGGGPPGHDDDTGYEGLHDTKCCPGTRKLG